MYKIIINATAIRSSGALTILKDFISYVFSLNAKDILFLFLTSTNNVFHDCNNVIVHEVPVQNWFSRIIWDRKGLQKWCEDNNIIPDVSISFQNTCAHFTGKYKNVKQLVYYHNILPLVSNNWNILKKEERKLYLYAHFYRFFVNRWNKSAVYVVQLSYVKQLLCNKFTNITSSQVQVIRPNLPNINPSNIEAKETNDYKKLFIYPATPFEYKNHRIILDALELLKNEEPNLAEKIRIIFTVPEDCQVSQVIKERELDDIINCIGSNPYDVLLTYYKRCDALLFPSKIESFGLPLVEASLFGVPVIAADLPYAREVLANYEGASFVDVDNAEMWMKQIKQLLQSNKKYKPLTQNVQNTWEELMDVMNSFLHK